MQDRRRKTLWDTYLSSHLCDLNPRESFENMIPFYQLNYCAHLPVQKDSRILDIGCGMGHFLFFLKHENYSNFLGVDISLEAVNYCESNITSRVKLVNDLESFLRGNKNTFHCVVMNDVLEHLPKEEIIFLLQNVRRSIAPGGTLIVKTNNLASIVGMYTRYHDFTHEVGFTEQSLRQVLLVAGFKEVSILPIKYYSPSSLKRRLRLWANSMLHTIWRFAFYIEFQDIPRVTTNLIIGIGKI